MTSYPKAVYLEASILCGNRTYIPAAQIGALVKICQNLKVPIFVPEVSFQEWVRKSREDVSEKIRQVDDHLRKLAGLFGPLNIDWMKHREDIIADTETCLRRFLDQNRISILPIPENIDIKKLVHMSVNKIRPFEERGEKGFRDCVTLFTVLEYAKDQQNGSHILVANDKVYEHDDVVELAKTYHVQLVTTSTIREAVSRLEAFLQARIKAERDKESLVLKKFLEQNISTITEFMKKVDWPLSFLNKGGRLGLYVERAEIKDIQAKIKSAIRGVLPEDFSEKKEGNVSILFEVEVHFDIMAAVITPQPPSKPKVSYDEVYSALSDYLGKVWPRNEIESGMKGIDDSIFFGGSVLLTRVKDKQGNLIDKYSDLHIEETYTQ